MAHIEDRTSVNAESEALNPRRPRRQNTSYSSTSQRAPRRSRDGIFSNLFNEEERNGDTFHAPSDAGETLATSPELARVPIRRRTTEPTAVLDPEDALYHDSGDPEIDALYDEENILGPSSGDERRRGLGQLFNDTEEDLRLYGNRTKQRGKPRTAGNSTHRHSTRRFPPSASLTHILNGSHANSSRRNRQKNHESYDRPVRFNRQFYGDSYRNSSRPYSHAHNGSYERRPRHRSRTPYDTVIDDDFKARLHQGNTSEEDEAAASDEVEQEDSCASDAESNLSFQFSLSSRGPTDQPDDPSMGDAEREANALMAINADPDQPLGNQTKAEVARLEDRTNIKLEPSITEGLPKTFYNVLHSNYVGTSYGSSISVNLKASQGSNTLSQIVSPLFRWIHITPPVGENGCMDFHAFIESALQAPGLNQADKIDLKKTLLWACEKSEKPLRTLQGQRGYYLDPIFNEVRSSTKKRRRSEKKSFWLLCMPYFSLGKYATKVLSQKSSSHPVRTLLQSQYPSVSKERDMQQAVSLAAETPNDYCYHVPQLWSLIVNGKLLITYAPMDIQRLCRNKISINVVPLSNNGGEKFIEVFESSSRLWLFPLDTCRTWFTFIAHFAEEVSLLDNVEDFYVVYHNGRKLTPASWPGIVKLAEASKVRVRVKRLDPLKAQSTMPWHRDDYQTAKDKETDISSSSSSSDSQAYIGTTSKMPSKYKPQIMDSSRSWDRSIATRDNHETTFPEHAVDVDRIKSLGYELVVQDDKIIFSKSLSPLEIDVILHLSIIFRESPQEMRHHIESVNTDYFNLFLWMSRGQNASWDAKVVYDSLFSTLKYLWNIPNNVERKAFRKCPLSCKAEIEQFLHKEEKEWYHSSKIKNLFRATKSLLGFFIPIEIDATVVRKYWGAVYRIIYDQKFVINVHMLKRFEIMAETLRGLQSLLSGSKAPSDLKFPNDFVKAWLHCLMFLILVEPRATHRATHHLSKAYNLILQGKLQILREAAESSLRARQAALPQGLLLTAVSGLIQDMTDGRPDVITTYWDYLRQLELDIKASPLKRSHQRKILSLKQEVGAVSKTLEGQSDVLSELKKAILDQIFRSKRNRHRNRLKDPEMMILRNSLNAIDAKIEGFKEITEHANTLRIENLRMIESNKDRQEAAIYAFTIVTVIFLPLSFVSSLLGMNTSDIRDMKQGQWLYWGAAIPLTGLIIILCLLFTGDIIDLAQWMRKLVPRRANVYSHNILPTDSSSNTSESTIELSINNQSWARRFSTLTSNFLSRRVAERFVANKSRDSGSRVSG